MTLYERAYPIAPKGYASNFTNEAMTPDFAFAFLNRFTNAAGGAEKRQGIESYGSAGSNSITGFHELIQKDGTKFKLASSAGKIFRDSNGTWTQVYASATASERLRSVQMGEKLIFMNGSDRMFYTTDASAFHSLEAIVQRGDADSNTDTNSLHDADVTVWATDTDVAINDILHNITRDGYGAITALNTASAAHTVIGTGGTGLGLTSGDQASGDRYRIIDGVELNIIPTDEPGFDDNVATTTGDTSAAGIFVSGVSWPNTEIRVGDWIRNTTRSAVTAVTAISSAQIGVHGVASQTAGDSLIFIKSAMPIGLTGHVHFGRFYVIDSRDKTKIRISGKDNPEDMTTDAATLDSTSVDFGAFQSEGDTLQAISSYQRFLVVAGRENVYYFQGTDPITDTSSQSLDFNIIGTFPKGVVTERSLVPLGNDLAYVSWDGLEGIALVQDSLLLGRANLSEQIRNEIREAIKDTPEDDIQAWHYARRSWLMLKVGSKIYVFNYTPYMGRDRIGGQLRTNAGAFHVFDGPLATKSAFFETSDGDLLVGGANGKIYRFDQETYDDDGTNYRTEYRTAWLTGDEPKKSVRQKQGRYIKPYFEAGAEIEYTIRADAGFEKSSNDSITVTAKSQGQAIGVAVIGSAAIGGGAVDHNKYSLRWRGEQVQITFTTDDAKGPDILGRTVLYLTAHGKR